jgi:hypothetical protein
MGLDAATRDRVATFMAASPVDRAVSALQTIYGLVFMLGVGVIVLATKGSLHYRLCRGRRSRIARWW